MIDRNCYGGLKSIWVGRAGFRTPPLHSQRGLVSHVLILLSNVVSNPGSNVLINGMPYLGQILEKGGGFAIGILHQLVDI